MNRANGRKIIGGCLLLLLTACTGSPSAPNIALRKQNQQLTSERDQLLREHAADVATLKTYETKNAVTPGLPEARLARLFTAHDLSVGRLTGGHRPATAAFDDGFSVYVVPTDDDGDPIKSAGAFKIEAFQLQEPTHPLIGTWSFNLDQTRKLFYAHLSLYTYVLQCPWQIVPKHRQLTLHITFIDQLTGRQLSADRTITAEPPPSPQN